MAKLTSEVQNIYINLYRTPLSGYLITGGVFDDLDQARRFSSEEGFVCTICTEAPPLTELAVAA